MEADRSLATVERITTLEGQNDELTRQLESARAEIARLREGAPPVRTDAPTTRGRAVVLGLGVVVVAILGAAAFMNWQLARQARTNGGYPVGVAPPASPR